MRQEERDKGAKWFVLALALLLLGSIAFALWANREAWRGWRISPPQPVKPIDRPYDQPSRVPFKMLGGEEHFTRHIPPGHTPPPPGTEGTPAYLAVTLLRVPVKTILENKDTQPVWNGDTAYIVLVPSTPSIRVLGETVLVVDIPLLDTDVLTHTDTQFAMWRNMRERPITPGPEFDIPGWATCRRLGHPPGEWYWTYRVTVRVRVETSPVEGTLRARILTSWPPPFSASDTMMLHRNSIEGPPLWISVR